AARAAHDLRAPLVPIQTLASLIVRAERDEGDARLAKRIGAAAERMSALIDGMLVFSRSGRLPRGSADLRGAVDAARDELGAATTGAQPVVEIQDASVACAPEVLGQILRNVLGNALKYRAPDRPCRLEITTRIEARWVTLAVADNGRGMEAGAV